MNNSKENIKINICKKIEDLMDLNTKKEFEFKIDINILVKSIQANLPSLYSKEKHQDIELIDQDLKYILRELESSEFSNLVIAIKISNVKSLIESL